MAPKYQLTYFDARGSAELIRLLLHAAGQSFEDVRVDGAGLKPLKPDLPFGSLPALKIDDGKYMAQSYAIAGYVAREHGFYGETSMDVFQVDQVLGGIRDLFLQLAKCFMERDAAVKEELKKDLKENTIPKYFKAFEKLIKENGESGFFVGSKMSLADIAIFDIVDFCNTFGSLLDLADFPKVKANNDKVATFPTLVEYLKHRK